MKEARPAKLVRTELAIAFVLRFGVLLCGLIIMVGVVLTWLNPASLHTFAQDVLPRLVSGAMVDNSGVPRRIPDLVSGLIAFHPAVVISCGLLLLILLPVTRVAMTVVLFLFEGDYLYFFITFFVLTILLSGLIFGKAL